MIHIYFRFTFFYYSLFSFILLYSFICRKSAEDFRIDQCFLEKVKNCANICLFAHIFVPLHRLKRLVYEKSDKYNKGTCCHRAV